MEPLRTRTPVPAPLLVSRPKLITIPSLNPLSLTQNLPPLAPLEQPKGNRPVISEVGSVCLNRLRKIPSLVGRIYKNFRPRCNSSPLIPSPEWTSLANILARSSPNPLTLVVDNLRHIVARSNGLSPWRTAVTTPAILRRPSVVAIALRKPLAPFRPTWPPPVVPSTTPPLLVGAIRSAQTCSAMLLPLLRRCRTVRLLAVAGHLSSV